MKLYKTHVKTKSALNLSYTENSPEKVPCSLLSTFGSVITILNNKNVCYLKEILQAAIGFQLFFK